MEQRILLIGKGKQKDGGKERNTENTVYFAVVADNDNKPIDGTWVHGFSATELVHNIKLKFTDLKLNIKNWTDYSLAEDEFSQYFIR